MRRFIIDTDAASDDLVACILALRDPGCVVEAITICAGVLDHETANVNGRVAVEIAKRDQPPVYTGMTKPLWRAPMTGENAHGKDGLSDVGLSKTTLPFTPGHAVDKIIELALKYDDLEIVTLGPMTNIAMAVMLNLEAMKRVKRIWTMGGQYRMPNPVTPNAEYNIWVDAESCDIVLQSGIPVTFVPLDACYGVAEVTREDRERLLSYGTEFGDFIVNANQKLLQFNIDFYDKDIISQPDPTAVAAALCEGVVLEQRTCTARCESKSEPGYGQIVYDFDSKEPHNVTVVTKFDGKKFKDYLHNTAAQKV